MPRVIGIDPGTVSIDLCGLDDGQLFLDRSFPTAVALAAPGASGGIGGLAALVRALARSTLPVVLTPGVLHLPTVPEHRKVNRVDMGTAEKVCAVALAIDEQARRLARPGLSGAARAGRRLHRRRGGGRRRHRGRYGGLERPAGVPRRRRTRRGSGLSRG